MTTIESPMNGMKVRTGDDPVDSIADDAEDKQLAVDND